VTGWVKAVDRLDSADHQSDAFVFYSNFTEAQLVTGAQLLCERLVEDDFESVYVYKKYSNKKFLRASTFARDWAINNTRTQEFEDEQWCEQHLPLRDHSADSQNEHDGQ